MASLGQRHADELANQQARYQALQASLAQMERERDSLEDSLASLRAKLEQQLRELDTATQALASLQAEKDRVAADRERLAIQTSSLEADKAALSREGAKLTTELQDARGDRDRLAQELARIRDLTLSLTLTLTLRSLNGSGMSWRSSQRAMRASLRTRGINSGCWKRERPRARPALTTNSDP